MGANDFYFWSVFGAIIWGIIWGCVANLVIHNKGYDENWFWWGFFFSFIAVIIAATKPENRTWNHEPTSDSEGYSFGSNYGHSNLFHDTSSTARQEGMWECAWCHKMSNNYVGTCSCGKTKTESDAKRQEDEQISKAFYEAQKTAGSVEPVNETQKTLDNIEAIKKLKELLDMGAITQEEFDQKKKELL